MIMIDETKMTATIDTTDLTLMGEILTAGMIYKKAERAQEILQRAHNGNEVEAEEIEDLIDTVSIDGSLNRALMMAGYDKIDRLLTDEIAASAMIHIYTMIYPSDGILGDMIMVPGQIALQKVDKALDEVWTYLETFCGCSIETFVHCLRLAADAME